MSKQYVSESCSEQVGTILKVEADKVWVVIEQKSACVSCHARGACSSFDKKDKEIEVRTEKAAEYKQGDKVKVVVKRQNARGSYSEETLTITLQAKGKAK